MKRPQVKILILKINYFKELDVLDVNKRLNLSNGDGNASLNSNSTTYRNQVLEEYLKNESQHIEELQHVLTGILFNVKNAQM